MVLCLYSGKPNWEFSTEQKQVMTSLHGHFSKHQFSAFGSEESEPEGPLDIRPYQFEPYLSSDNEASSGNHDS